MTQFDLYLRQALMDANLEQYENVIRKAESKELDASPRYVQERMRLLTDPWNWEKRQGGRKRLDWRLIAIVAALLLLSACAYAVATGQFSQWFPRVDPNPAAPENSEDILSRTGTVIQQTQTTGDATVTLNAAVWDGNNLHLSLVLESPNIPEEVQANTWLYTEECSLELRDDQWREYTRKKTELDYAEMGMPLDSLEDSIQDLLDGGQVDHDIYPVLVNREGDTLTFEILWGLSALVERPELTLHLENIATYEDGKGDGVAYQDEIRTGPGPSDVIFGGPIDFTFTLDEPLFPIRYGGDVELTLKNIPLRFTEFEIAVFNLEVSYKVPNTVNLVQYDPENPDTDTLTDHDALVAVMDGLLGLWMEDGNYLDLAGMSGSMGMRTNEEGLFSGSAGRSLPYVVDPAAVTAVNIGGVRVELGELEVLTE